MGEEAVKRLGHQPDRSPWAALLPLCLAVSLYKLDTTIVNVALPSIQADLRTTPESLTWTVSSYILALTVSIPLAGALGDRLGRRRLFIWGMVAFGFFSAACGLAPGDGWLIAGRGLQGLAAGVMMPLSMAIIGGSFRDEDLPAAYGLWSGTSSIGFVVGPLIGGVLVESLGWQSVFWVNVPLSLLFVPLTLRLVPADDARHAHPIDWPGVVLSTLSLALVAWALIGTTHESWTSGATLLPLIGGCAGAGLFLLWERRAEHALLPLGLFRARGFALGGAVGAIVYVFPAVLLLLTLYFQGILGRSPAEAAVLFLPLAGSLTVVAVAAGPITERIGALRSMTLGMLLMAAGGWGLACLGDPLSTVVLAAAEISFGTGIMLTIPAASAVMMEAVPRERAATGSAAMQASRQIGALLAVAALSAVAAARTLAVMGEIHARGSTLINDVVGARLAAVRQEEGADVAVAATNAWIAGMRSAMVVVAALALIGAVLCVAVGLRRRDRRSAARPQASG